MLPKQRERKAGAGPETADRDRDALGELDGKDGSEGAQPASGLRDLKQRARERLEDGRPAEARTLLERAAREEPNDPATLGLLLKAARAEGREEDELAICRRFRERFPDRPIPQIRLLGLLEARQAPETEALALDLRQRFPDHFEPVETLARLAEQAGRRDRAGRLWKEMLELLRARPPAAHRLKRLGRELLELERPETAQEVLERAARETPDDDAVLRLLLRATRAMGREDDELVIYRRFRESFPEQPTPQLRLLRLLEARQAPETEELARDLDRRFPNRSEPLETLARLAEQAGDHAGAADFWAEMLARFPEGAPAKQALRALKCLGRALLEHKRPQAAQAALDQAAGAEPRDAATLGLLLEAARAQGREEDELATCQRFRKHFPERPTPQFRLLALLEARQAPETEALALDLRQRFPDRAEALAALARLAEQAGDWATAARRWGEVLERFAGRPPFAEARRALRDWPASDCTLEAMSSARAAMPENHWLIAEIAFLEQQRFRFVTAAAAWKEWLSFRAECPSHYLDASQAFLEAGEPMHVLRALRLARAQGADVAAVVRARATLAERLHRWPAAFRLWRRAISLSPDDPAPVRRLIRCLVEAGAFHEAEARLREAMAENPDSADLLLIAIRRMQRLLREGDALEALTRATRSFPNDPRTWAGLARAYSTRLETEKAETICRDVLKRLEHPCIRLALAEVLAQRRSFDDALSILAAVETNQLWSLKAAQTKARIYLQRDRFADASATLLRALRERPGAISAVVDLAQVHIRAGEEDEAERILCEISPEFGTRSDVAELRAWTAARRGDAGAARAIWKRHVESHIPAARPLSTPLVAAAPAGGCDYRLQLFAFLRNERTRLPFFLDYYRNLGVERFLLVDNGSDDGSAEFLDAQRDVSRFPTTQGYREAASGMRWINHLVGRFGGMGWCLHVDLDEFLVLPGSESGPLDRYLAYLEGNDYEVVRSFLIDMFPKSFEEAEAYEAGDNPLICCRLFDNDYRFYGGVRCPYVMVEGGFRERHFKQFGLHLCKTPLIRCGRGIRFLASSHVTTPARVAKLTAASLHFKFLGRFRERLAEEAERRQYSNAAKNINQLHATLSAGPVSGTLAGPKTLRYSDSRQLLALGLIAEGGFDSSDRG